MTGPDISPESRETKVLWRQWEWLHLVRRVLHRRFHELEGQGWRHQLGASVYRRGPYGTPGNGCGRTIPHHLHRESILPDGGVLFLEMARVFPHPGPEGHDGRSEAGIRDVGTLWSIPGVA